MQLICGDAIEEMQKLPERSVDLVLTDPPYNIGVTTKIAGKSVRHEWDKRPDYIPWCVEWIKACIRVLKPNGVLYFGITTWHKLRNCSRPSSAKRRWRLYPFAFGIRAKPSARNHGKIETRKATARCARGLIFASTACIFLMRRRMQTRVGGTQD